MPNVSRAPTAGPRATSAGRPEPRRPGRACFRVARRVRTALAIRATGTPGASEIKDLKETPIARERIANESGVRAMRPSPMLSPVAGALRPNAPRAVSGTGANTTTRRGGPAARPTLPLRFGRSPTARAGPPPPLPQAAALFVPDAPASGTRPSAEGRTGTPATPRRRNPAPPGRRSHRRHSRNSGGFRGTRVSAREAPRSVSRRPRATPSSWPASCGPAGRRRQRHATPRARHASRRRRGRARGLRPARPR